ncbi:unnamed protein product, partial [Ixodes persulcatus]
LRSETLTTLATLLTDGLLGSYSSSSSSSSSLMNCGLLRTPDEEVKAGFLEGSACHETCARAGSGPMTLGMGRTSDTLLDATCFSGGGASASQRDARAGFLTIDELHAPGSGSALSASTSSLYSPSPRNSGTFPLGSTSLGPSRRQQVCALKHCIQSNEVITKLAGVRNTLATYYLDVANHWRQRGPHQLVKLVVLSPRKRDRSRAICSLVFLLAIITMM